MRRSTDPGPRRLAAGVLATLTMDVAFVVSGRARAELFTTERLEPGLIGRWTVRVARGDWRGADVSTAPRSAGEQAIGLGVHYLTGVVLTCLYLAAHERALVRPGSGSAVAYGVGTSALPLLVMFPSMGYGCCGLRSGEAGRLLRIMLVGHVAFGAGIGLWTSVLGLTRPKG